MRQSIPPGQVSQPEQRTARIDTDPRGDALIPEGIRLTLEPLLSHLEVRDYIPGVRLSAQWLRENLPARKMTPERGEMGELTVLIQKAQQGDAAAQEAVFAKLYNDLKRIAHARLAGTGHQTLLDTCALINETYLRLAQANQLHPESRAQYLAYASRVMRSIIVDFVRARSAERRGGGMERVTLAPAISDSASSGEDEILKVHDALQELAAIEPRLVTVVEMRYFGGLTEQEIAATLGVTDRTVRRDWQKARLLLAAAIG